MDTPTPCPRCGDVVDLDDMIQHPNEHRTLVCEECRDAIDEENNKGEHIDACGNKVKWSADPEWGSIEFSVNGEELATWGYEDDLEDAVRRFCAIWDKAVSLAVSKE